MRRLPSAPPTVPDVKDYLIRFLGSNPFNQIRNQTGDSPFGAQLCCPPNYRYFIYSMVHTLLRFRLHGLWAQSPSRGSSQQNVMPRFPFPTVGPLDLGSPPYRSEQSDHRYYGPLRLPNAHLGLLRYSLSSPDTLVAPLLSLTGQGRAFLSRARTPPRWLTGALDRIYYSRKHLALPSSQITPLTACPARRPRWCPDRLP